MLISVIILVITFLVMIVLIAIGTFDRFIVALGAALVAFFVLYFLEGATFAVFVSLVIGSPGDNYVNFHALILILGMMIIVVIAIEGGLFHFIAFRLIQMTKGEPKRLLIVFCTLAMFMTAILNDFLTVLILIPLTVTICRILDIDPFPYIIAQAITIKLGATMLMISSISTILITSYLAISFVDYFIRVGLISILIFGLTILFFLAIFQNRLKKPRKGIDMLLSYKVWDFIPNKSLMFKSTFILIIVILGFIFIPSTLISPDIIAMSCAVILLFISKIDSKEIMKKIDFKIILYLMGIFIISGALEYVGFVEDLGIFMAGFGSNDILITFLISLWFSAIVSSCIDNVPVCRILIPTVGIMTNQYSYNEKVLIYSGMIYGINWGDNLSPFGDTLFVAAVAEENKVKFKMFEFFKIGFITTIFQLCVVTIIFSLILRPVIGVILLLIAIGITLPAVFLFYNNTKKKASGRQVLNELVKDQIEPKKKKWTQSFKRST